MVECDADEADGMMQGSVWWKSLRESTTVQVASMAC